MLSGGIFWNNYVIAIQKNSWTKEMTQNVKMLESKSDNLSSIPWIHTMEGDPNPTSCPQTPTREW